MRRARRARPWRALTLDAPGSLRAACGFVILLGVATVSLRLSLTERGRYRVLGATVLYGLYAPVQATPAVLGPLLNGNHLGGL